MAGNLGFAAGYPLERSPRERLAKAEPLIERGRPGGDSPRETSPQTRKIVFAIPWVF